MSVEERIIQSICWINEYGEISYDEAEFASELEQATASFCRGCEQSHLEPIGTCDVGGQTCCHRESELELPAAKMLEGTEIQDPPQRINAGSASG